MRIGRRGLCFRRPPKQQPKRSSSSSFNINTSNYYMMTKKTFNKPNYAFHVPGAPLNTTSYLIKSKGITTHHCHYQPQHQQQNTTSMKNNEYRLNDSLVLDGYGSMKGLIGLSSILLNERSEETNGGGGGGGGGGESNSPSKQQVRDRVQLGSKVVPRGRPPRLLSLRIKHRDDQIANLEEKNMMMKERMYCIERDLDQLKHRVKVLEEVAQNAAMRTVLMIRDCCYCGDAVSVA